jgi:hypothetical protein
LEAGFIHITPEVSRALDKIVNGGLLGYSTDNVATFSPVAVGSVLKRSDYPVEFDSLIGNLTIAGNAYLRRVKRHSYNFGLSEQFNRQSG